VGIGNELLGDEGLGVHVARALAAAPALPASAEVVEAGLAPLDLAGEMVRRERVILVDALRAGRAPGTLYRLELREEMVERMPSDAVFSLHQWGLADTLRAIALMGMLPRRVTVLGAEPERVAPGLGLSPVGARAVERLVAVVLAELGCGAGAAADARGRGVRTGRSRPTAAPF
jgi:hydrogenase maturation protease